MKTNKILTSDKRTTIDEKVSSIKRESTQKGIFISIKYLLDSNEKELALKLFKNKFESENVDIEELRKILKKVI